MLLSILVNLIMLPVTLAINVFYLFFGWLV